MSTFTRHLMIKLIFLQRVFKEIQPLTRHSICAGNEGGEKILSGSKGTHRGLGNSLLHTSIAKAIRDFSLPIKFKFFFLHLKHSTAWPHPITHWTFLCNLHFQSKFPMSVLLFIVLVMILWRNRTNKKRFIIKIGSHNYRGWEVPQSAICK